jgi:hypothetical protein
MHLDLNVAFSLHLQVEVGATCFDIIMYSFDAWSFGALLENERKERRASPRQSVKSFEVYSL